MDPVLKHNLEHNGLGNANQWLGFRFNTYYSGVMEVVKRRDSAVNAWEYRVFNDPDSPSFPISTNELLETYTVQLERLVLQLQKDFS